MYQGKQIWNTTTAVPLAQARKSSLGERLSRSSESVSPRRDTNSGKKRKLAEPSLGLDWFAQTRSWSRSGDPSSPRRGFVQEQRCVSWYFRSGERYSPRRKYQDTNLFLHAASQFPFNIIQLLTKITQSMRQFINLNMQFKLIHGSSRKFKERVSFPYLYRVFN